MIRIMYFAEVHETPRKHENSKKSPIWGVPEFFVEGHCTRSVNLHYIHDSPSQAGVGPTVIFVHICVVFNRRGETRGVFRSIVRLECRDMR